MPWQEFGRVNEGVQFIGRLLESEKANGVEPVFFSVQPDKPRFDPVNQ